MGALDLQKGKPRSGTRTVLIADAPSVSEARDQSAPVRSRLYESPDRLGRRSATGGTAKPRGWTDDPGVLSLTAPPQEDMLPGPRGSEWYRWES